MLIKEDFDNAQLEQGLLEMPCHGSLRHDIQQCQPQMSMLV
jgi:hypothetical protein